MLVVVLGHIPASAHTLTENIYSRILVTVKGAAIISLPVSVGRKGNGLSSCSICIPHVDIIHGEVVAGDLNSTTERV